MIMFKYTKAAIDILINDIRKYCNIFKYGSMIFTVLYFIYAIFSNTGNYIINSVLLGLFLFYIFLDLSTGKKEVKLLKRFILKGYKILKFTTKTFSLFVMVYSIYNATTNVSAISIILATLMIIMWVLQLLFEIVIQLFNDKKDLIVAGWNKDIENLKRPVTNVTNFIKKVKGEEVIEDKTSNTKEIKILEKKIKEKELVK